MGNKKVFDTENDSDEKGGDALSQLNPEITKAPADARKSFFAFIENPLPPRESVVFEIHSHTSQRKFATGKFNSRGKGAKAPSPVSKPNYFLI